MNIEYFSDYKCEVLQFCKTYSTIKHSRTTCSCYKYLAGYFIIMPNFTDLVISLDGDRIDNIKDTIHKILISKHDMFRIIYRKYILEPTKILTKRDTLSNVFTVTLQLIADKLIFKIYNKERYQYLTKIKIPITDDQLKFINDQYNKDPIPITKTL